MADMYRTDEHGNWVAAEPMDYIRPEHGLDWEVYSPRETHRTWIGCGYDALVCEKVVESHSRILLHMRMLWANIKFERNKHRDTQ